MTEPIADVSATDEPEMPLMIVVARMLTCDSPPRIRVKPTMTAAKSTSRRAMPPSAMIAPASTKNGMVSIDTLPTPLASCCMPAATGRSIHSAPTRAASAIANAIGMPMAKNRHMLRRRTAISIGLPCVGRETLFEGYVRIAAGWRWSDGQPFDHEQQHHGAADRDRQVGDADGQPGEFI